MQFPLFLLSEWRKAGESTLPPMGAAVKLQLPNFLHSQWKIQFTTDESGGKAATAGFPPLTVEESWKMRLYRPCKRR
ncbi:hypothetical protein AAC387_Pa08g0699 [Persea americana]